jgi:cytochrome P450
VLTGGIDPVSACLGSAMAELLSGEGAVLDAVDDGSLDPSLVVEEALRFDAPFHFVPRVTTIASEVAGVTIPPGQRVQLLIAAANRDPAVFTRPNEFVVKRQEAAHLAFGASHHYCLGAGVARLTLREALRALAAWPQRASIRALLAERKESHGSTLWKRIGVVL